MKFNLRTFCLASSVAAFVCVAGAARADTITGAFAAGGGVAYTSNTITFNGTPATTGPDLGTVDGTVTTDTPTGTFLTYLGTGGQSVTYFPAFPTGATLDYATGTNSVPSSADAPGQTGVELLTVTGGGETFDYYMTDYSATYTSGTTACPLTCLAVTGDGYYTGTGVDNFTDSIGQFTFTSQYLPGQSVNTSFSASTNVAPTPEPASLLLLGTGILGLAAFGRRKLFA